MVKHFLRLQFLYLGHALVFLLPCLLYLNVSRIERVTGISYTITTVVCTVIALLGLAFAFMLSLRVTGRPILYRVFKFLSFILWFPYFILLVYLYNLVTPPISPGDTLSPGAGILIIILLIGYVFYLLMVEFFSLLYHSEAEN